MGWLREDTRDAIRSASQRPVFSALAVLIMALGIGAATAVFSVVDQTVLRRPPFLHGDRLVDVMNIRRGGGGGSGHSAEKLLGWREQTSVFERLETFSPREFDLVGGGDEPERVTALAVSVGLFDMLGVQPILGRNFTPADAAPGGEQLVLVSRRLAERRLGGIQSSLGAKFAMSGQTYTVVGVMSDSFTLLGPEQAWVPIDPQHHLGQPRLSEFFVLGRLPLGLTVPQAQARANQIADRLQTDMPLARTWDIRIDEKRVTATRPSTRSAMLALLGVVACLLLLACVSVTHLVLSRMIQQRREFAIRASLGASRTAIVRHVLVEVGLLALAGSALGVLIATWTVRLFAASTPPPLAFWRTAAITVDGRILTASIAATLAVIAAGLLPGLFVSRPTSHAWLRATDNAIAPRPAGHASFALVATQVACAVMLAVGAGLMLRTISNVSRIPLGFEPEGLVLMNVNLPAARYPTAARQFEFFERVLERLRQTPGVSAAAVAGGLTVYGSGHERFSSSEVPELAADALAATNRVSDGYFETLGVRLLAGRTFTRGDMDDRVAVVGRTLAARLWPSGAAVGSTMKNLDDGRAWTVIGVVDDVDARPSHDRPIDLQWYEPRSTSREPTLAGQGAPANTYHRLIVRAASLEVGLAAAKASVWAVDPEQPIERVTRGSDEVRDVFASHRLVQAVTTVFSAIGLVVAAVGVFGVLSQLVAWRRREIGVRMALGATPRRIGSMVVGQAALMIAVGLSIGIVAASALTRWLQSVLYGITPWDGVSFVSAAILVTATGLVAAWWPARTAARVEPAVAMREE